jgi:uncharacterized protein (UPF0303 family)
MTSQSAEELIPVLEEQESRLVLESFTHDDAWRLERFVASQRT